MPHDIGRFEGNVKLNLLKEKLPQIHPVDLADILEELDHDHRVAIFNQLETEHASDTLQEVEPRVQRKLVSSLPIERVAEIVNEMTPAQAADILAALPELGHRCNPREARCSGSIENPFADREA